MGVHNHGGEWLLHTPYGMGDNSKINSMPMILFLYGPTRSSKGGRLWGNFGCLRLDVIGGIGRKLGPMFRDDWGTLGVMGTRIEYP